MLVDPTTGIAHAVEGIGQIENYAWSPDASRLAFTALHESPFEWQVGWIDIPKGTAHIIGTDESVYTEYDGLAWAPDGRRFGIVWDRPAGGSEILACREKLETARGSARGRIPGSTAWC